MNTARAIVTQRAQLRVAVRRGDIAAALIIAARLRANTCDGCGGAAEPLTGGMCRSCIRLDAEVDDRPARIRAAVR